MIIRVIASCEKCYYAWDIEPNGKTHGLDACPNCGTLHAWVFIWSGGEMKGEGHA
jgi:hypothetical protein